MYIMLLQEFINTTVPILFLWNSECKSYISNSYNQIFTKEILLKNILGKFTFPITVLWIGRDWSDKYEYWHSYNHYIYKDDLPDYTSIGCLAQIENIEEFSDNSLRLSITTRGRVKISDIHTNSVGIYCGKYKPYDDLPVEDQEKEQILNIIEKIKEKLLVLKKLKPDLIEELEFPVYLRSKTLSEYASEFSLNIINVYKRYNYNEISVFFITQNVSLRLQNILLQLQLSIEQY